MTVQTYRASFDTYANEDHVNTNYGDAVKLRVNGNGSSEKFSYLHFNVHPDPSATIVNATLTMYLRGAWSGGPHTVSAERITQKWKEGHLTWSDKPTVGGSAVTAAVTGGVANEAMSFDVTAIVQAWVNGKAVYGLRLKLDTSGNKDFHSSEAADPTYRPVLTIEYALPPDAPDNLRPDGARAVSDPNPLMLWDSDTPSEVKIQLDNDVAFGSPLWDPGYVASTDTQYDTTALTALTDNTTYYWRVRIKDANGVESDWSETAEFQYRSLAATTVTAPAADVTTTRPTITWTLGGTRTQAYYAIRLFENNVLVYSKPKQASTATSFELPAGYIRDPSATYFVRVVLWDTFDRETVGDAYGWSEDDSVTFQLDLTGGTAPAALDVTQVDGHVHMTWTRASAPDYFIVKAGGVIVDDAIDPDDAFVSGTTYEYDYYGANPWESSATTYEVAAEVAGVLTGSNPTDTLTFQPTGIWLCDPEDGTSINLAGKEAVGGEIGESGATYYPLSTQSPVRISDMTRGFEGSCSGTLVDWGQDILVNRDNFYTLKSRVGRTLRLVYGRKNIPVVIGAASMEMLPLQEEVYQVSFEFFQNGEFDILQEI